MSSRQISDVTPREMWRCAALAAVYIALAFLLPVNTQALHLYHLSSAGYRVLLVVVVLPILAVWFAAFHGFSKLRQYHMALSSANAKEQAVFDKLSRGFQWLAWGLAITMLISLILSAVANKYTGFHPAAVIVNNYLMLLITLVGFSYISRGSRELIVNAKTRFGTGDARALIFSFMAFGVIFCFLVFRHLDLNSLSASDNPYYLPIWLVMLTIVIPYLYVWFMGALAIYEMNLYGRYVHGILYRQPMHLLSTGLSAVILGSISVQYILSAIPRYEHPTLGFILIAIYTIYLVTALGYALVSVGAGRLKRIEEV